MIGSLPATATADAEGAALHAFAAQLYPICRSITGDGVRRTLDLIGRRIGLQRHEVPSGSRVFDWEVPPEWNIADACVSDRDGRRLVDFRAHNLHILNYSEPVRCQISLEQLRPKLHSLPAHPEWIPYRTSYYRRDWGFCLPHRQLASLQPGAYDVLVDSSLSPTGSLSYAECLLRGRSDREVLFFTHVCHPSLANDNTSGMAIATALAEWIGGSERRYSYRFVFAPGTIGSLCWLKANESRLGRIAHGLVLGLLGDAAPLTYKFSRRGDCDIDRVVPFALRSAVPAGSTIAFEPYGYDERQLCSPGFNLPVGRLTRSVNGGYPQYHSSADDLSLIRPEQLRASLETLKHVVEILEGDRRYLNLSPKGEPRLGKRGLYGAIGGRSPADRERAMLWVLNQSDGTASVLDIAQRSQLRFADVRDAAEELARAGLLKAAQPARRAAAAKRTAPGRATGRKSAIKRNSASRRNKGVRQ